MATEKIMHRTGQLIGTEKRPCTVCKKDTNQDVVHFFTKTSSIAFGSLGAVGGLINAAKFNVNAPDGAFIGYVCNECKSLSIPKEQRDIKKKYGWSNFWGFKGKPKEDIEFKVWKLS